MTPSGKTQTDKEKAIEDNFNQQQRQYEKVSKPYNRNISMIMLGVAVVFLVLSLVFEHRLPVLADGIMFGGLFTLIYSIIRGFISQESKYVFAVVTVGLIAVLYLSYRLKTKIGLLI